MEQKVKALKRNCLIKGIDFSDAYYEGLQALLAYLSNPGELALLKEEDFETYKRVIEPYFVLINTLDQAAEQQELTKWVTIPPSGDAL